MLAASKLKRLSRSRSATPSPHSSAHTSPFKCSPGMSAVLKMGNSLTNALKREGKSRRCSASKSPTPSPCSSANSSPVRDGPRLSRGTRSNNVDCFGHSPSSSKVLQRGSAAADSKATIIKTSRKASNSPLPSSHSYVKAMHKNENSSRNSSPFSSTGASKDSNIVPGPQKTKKEDKSYKYVPATSSKTSSSCSSPMKLSPLKGGGTDSLQKHKSKSFSSGSYKGSRKAKFSLGQDVLARWSDGLFYLGSILKVKPDSY